MVVDDVEQDRRAVDRGEQKGLVEVALGGRSVADVAVGQPVVALVGRGHGPAHRLAELGAEVARDGEEAVGLGGVEHRQLPPLKRVGGVGVALVHHVHERIAAGDQDPLLAIGREAHVARTERKGLADRHGLLARALQIERGLPLPLLAVHAVVKGPHQKHGAQASLEHLHRRLGVPRADGPPFLVEHPDQAVGMVPGVLRLAVHLGPRQESGRRDVHAREVDGIARPPLGLGNMEGERNGGLAHAGPPQEGRPRSWAMQR